MKSFFSLPLLFSLAASILGSHSTLVSAVDDLVLSSTSAEDYFVFEPTPEFPAISAETTTCKYNTVYDLCQDATPGGDFAVADLFQFCRLLEVTNFLEFDNQDKSFTLLAPTNAAVTRLFNEIWAVSGVGELIVKEILESGAIFGKVETRDLECSTSVKVISNAGKNPSIKCKGDIAGNPVSYIKGKGNKQYVPRFGDPSNPITSVCNAVIYKVEDVILLKKYPFP
eukprot:jgi/Psemu1/315235/fgenesh1_kg.1967_\